MIQNRPVLRRCVACRKVLDRQKLLKVTRDHQNGVMLKGGMGRSAYLCPNETCLEEAWRRKRLQKALRCPVEFSIVKMLEKELNTCNESGTKAI